MSQGFVPVPLVQIKVENRGLNHWIATANNDPTMRRAGDTMLEAIGSVVRDNQAQLGIVIEVALGGRAAIEKAEGGC